LEVGLDNGNDVVVDLKVKKIKRWMEKTKDREQWRLVVEEAKAHSGLYAERVGGLFISIILYNTTGMSHLEMLCKELAS
jgi:tetrahydromethanopterin S-methyltransferase subunit F